MGTSKIKLILKMNENDRNNSTNTMEQIIGNMTPEMQNVDGHYVPLGYSASTPNATGTVNWNHQPTNYTNHYNIRHGESQVYQNLPQQFEPQSYYVPQPQNLFSPNMYISKQSGYEVFTNMPNSSPGVEVFSSSFLNQNLPQQSPMHHISAGQFLNQQNPTHVESHTHLIENLVGNWISPTTTGTYSPFGNPDSFKSVGIFDASSDKENSRIPLQRANSLDEPAHIFMPVDQEEKFAFNRDTRKPRIVAEVKPMRPTYSDVLAKSVSPTASVVTKPLKIDNKDVKPKKIANKKVKTDKTIKTTSISSKSLNTSLDNKDSNTEKKNFVRGNEKMKNTKSAHVEKKWASMDDLSDSFDQKIYKNQKRDADDNYKTKIKFQKSFEDMDDSFDSATGKNENYVINKNGIRKNSKVNNKLKNNDSFNGNDRTSGKRNQRVKKRDNHILLRIMNQKLKLYLKGWWKIIVTFILWLFRLISDICSLSLHISQDMFSGSWSWLRSKWTIIMSFALILLRKTHILSWMYEKFRRKEQDQETPKMFTHSGLQHNLNMPQTGEEAMKRLLACKGKDPYSILGVSPGCADDDIKRYYKRQAFLVHPDKNQQPGAEEAFKILVHAFDMIGVSERRAAYDRGVAESAQVEQAWSELTELLAQLQKKVEAAANTIRCSACNLRHKRLKVDRPIYAARNCATCKIHHAAREGDIWAEARCFGFLWHYFACMEGAVYDITEWAGCQKESLKHLKPDSHHVQYRIALGKQNNNQQKNKQNSPSAAGTERQPDLENLINSLYGKSPENSQPAKKRNKKTK